MKVLSIDRKGISGALLATIVFASIIYSTYGLKHTALLIVGILLGITLLHAAFGFSGSWRAFIEKRESRGIRAHLWLLGLSSLLFIPLLYGSLIDIQLAPALAPAGLSVLIGAFLFGIGMQLGGGCGSGTLFTVGGGHANMLVTLLFFIIGSFIASAHLPFWASLPSLGKVSLVQETGIAGALIIQLAVLAVLYFVVIKLEQRRHQQVNPLLQSAATNSQPMHWLRGPWSLIWGVTGLTLLGLTTLLIAGHTWSITFAFGLWGAKIWSAIGGDLSNISYWSSGYPARALENSVLADVTSVMDIGIIIGAVLAASLAGRFAVQKTITSRMLWMSVIGGLLLGYGSRLAFGCNIGGLLGGIASGSLHGWLWLVAGFTGAIVGVKWRSLWIRQG